MTRERALSPCKQPWLYAKVIPNFSDDLETRQLGRAGIGGVAKVRVRGIRGAITVQEDTSEAILGASEELLAEILRRNEVEADDVVAVFFTVTDDLTAAFPAAAARRLGLDAVPALCSREIPVPGSLERCIRVLVQVHTDRSPDEIQHVYLGDAVSLRPDRAGSSTRSTNGTPALRPEVERIEPYVPGRSLEEVRRELGLRHVVKLASNENPLGPSPKALAALSGPGFLETLNRYPDASCRALREALARRHGLVPEQVVVGNGSDELLKLLGEAYLRPGDEVVMGSPSFSEYSYVARLLGAREVRVPLQGGQVTAADVLKAVTPRTRLVFLTTPNNPTGTALDPGEFQELVDRMPPHVVVAVDEAYREYVHPDRLIDSLGPVRQGKPWISLRTFSKIYGLAGLRVGYGLASPEVAGAIMRVKEPFNVSQAAQVAALAALDDEEHLRRSRELVWHERARLTRALAERGLRCEPSDANFILVWLGQPDGPVTEGLLREGVIVRGGTQLGVPGAIRVTIGLPRENTLFLEALDRVLGRLPVTARPSGGDAL